MEGVGSQPEKKFESPQEELAFLREQIAKKNEQLKSMNMEKSPEQVAQETISTYDTLEKEEVLHEEFQMSPAEGQEVVLQLQPEAHDSKIAELYGMLLERGIKNTLDVVARMHDPHLSDDFHRFLVQYLHTTGVVPGLKEKSPEFKSLNLTLFEVSLPPAAEEEKDFKDFLGAMEQFLAGMQSISLGEKNKFKQYFSIEIAVSHDSPHIVFYVAIPKERRDLLEKQILAFYKKARVSEVADDYNIFNPEGFVSASVGEFTAHKAFPIKTHDDLDHDPLNAILNTFSRLDHSTEGAALQFVITPAGNNFIKSFSKGLDKLKKGEKLRDAFDKYGDTKKELASFASGLFSGKDTSDEDKQKDVDDHAIENVTEKVKSTIVSTNIRIAASAPTEERTAAILADIEGAFEQFTKPNANAIEFDKVEKRKIDKFLHAFTYRMPEEDRSMPLNFKELATLVHFPVGADTSPELKEAKASTAPAPMGLKHEGVMIGRNKHRGEETPVHMNPKDRLRHFYVIGQTGTGKTTTLTSMAIQDIKAGNGVCFIDPHGTDIQTILSHVPKERIDDVIYFDPAYAPRPMGLNMLEYDTRYPEQKTFVINELMNIFNQLFDMKTAGGPMFEQYFKNAAGLVMDDPDSGSTLLEITRVLSDKTFRDDKLEKTNNPIIKQFWKNAEATKGEQGLENFIPYVTSKFDTFISNEIMRPIIAQQHSVLNMRDIMDNKKILLVNLSKGRLGDINSNLIGLLVVGKIQMAALSRVDSFGQDLPPFYLYIDEFQNVTTPSISSILSEARKYGLSLNVAHQYLGQLTDEIKGAILGNVGSMATFRISPEDAKELESRLKPQFTWEDMIKIENYNAYVSMLVDGQPTKAFNIQPDYYPPKNLDIVESLKELSYLKYGRPRAEVEAEILERFNKGNKIKV